MTVFVLPDSVNSFGLFFILHGVTDDSIVTELYLPSGLHRDAFCLFI